MGTGSVMLVLLLIATTVKSNQNCAITDSLVDIQTNAKILLISAPDEAPYKDGCCQVVKAADVKKPESIEYTHAKMDSSYVLLMLDPDAPSPAFLHWIIGNIKGSDLRNGVTSGANLLDYYEPSPPASSQHRYQFYLFEQKKEIEQVAEIQEKIKNHGRAPWTSEDIGKLLKSDLEVSSPAVAVFQYSAYTSDKPCNYDCKKCS